MNFDKFPKLAQELLPTVDLQSAVINIRDGLKTMEFHDSEFWSGRRF